MPIVCTICGKEYQSDDHLQKHLSNTHVDQGTCEIEIFGSRKYFNHLASWRICGDSAFLTKEIRRDPWNKNCEEEGYPLTSQYNSNLDILQYMK